MKSNRRNFIRNSALVLAGAGIAGSGVQAQNQKKAAISMN